VRGEIQVPKSPEEAMAAASPSAFAKTLKSFCDELRLTFPELGAPVDRAATVTATHYWHMWHKHLDILVGRDIDALFSVKQGFVISAVRMTPALWSEISGNTQKAIWRYLRTLSLEAAMEISMDAMTPEQMQALMDIMTAERMEAGGAEAEAAQAELFEETMGHLNPLMEKLKGMMGGFMDGVDLKDFPMPEIPEHLKRGKIARLAEQLSKQFKPEEFGIDPSMLEGDNVEEVLKRLAELYKRDPSMIMTGAKRMAEKIKQQVLGGSLKREELLAEAKEFVELFKSHPLFKEAIGKFEGLLGENGLMSMFNGGGGNAPSERLRATQERLRRKIEARKAAGRK
jgi:hypothetical protein